MLVYRFMRDCELRTLYMQFARKGYAVPTFAQSHSDCVNTFGEKSGQKNFWFFCSLSDAQRAERAFLGEDYTLVEFDIDPESLTFGMGYYGSNIFASSKNADVRECICQKIPAYAITGKFYESVYEEVPVLDEEGCIEDCTWECVGFTALTA